MTDEIPQAGAEPSRPVEPERGNLVPAGTGHAADDHNPVAGPLEEPGSVPTAGPRHPRANYVMRHWRGELSLPVSYWVNGILGDAVILVPALILRLILQADYKPLLAAIGLPMLWLGILAVTTWQAVGIWRSAGHRLHLQSAGVWAILARISVILGICVTSAELVNHAILEIVSVVKIAAGDAELGKHEVHLIRNGTELELVGTITFGVTDEVQSVLDGAPGVRVIHLNSRGGRVGEARKLRDLIHNRGLDVYTSTECDSACTVAYIGGLNRYISQTGRLGFHQAAFPGFRVSDIAAEDAKDKQALIAAGVPASFAEHAYSTPNDSMWYPTLQELRDARVVTAVASSNEFAASGIGEANPSESVEAMMVRLPVYAAIRTREPAIFAEIHDKMVAGYRNGVTDADLISMSRPYINTLAKKYLPLADDDVVVEMSSVVVREIDQVNAQNADACFALISPKPGTPAVDIMPYVTRETAEQDLAVLTKVIETGAMHPQPRPDSMDISATIQPMFKRLREQYGADIAVLGQFADPNVDHRKVCAMTSAMFKAILDLPDTEKVRVLRVFYTKAAEQ
jgi:hypothetical protein